MTTIVRVDDILNDDNLMKFVLQTIVQLEVIPTNFDAFLEFMKSSSPVFQNLQHHLAREIGID